ncbi:hypothetical protein MUP07_09475 [Candidatus Bathyarchaeota archaeon]|nr:hypothetical protein [Candidatus Bathyarchaeota archaeon]
MQRRTLLAIYLLATLVFSWSATSAYASSVQYSIQDEKASVNLVLHFFQNMTSMPSINTPLSGLSAEDLASALNEGLTAKDPSASISSVSGEIVSDKGWINSTIHFEVSGISVSRGDLLIVNCSWISFNVSRDLRLGNLSYNRIGAAYVRPTLETYVKYIGAPLNATVPEVMLLSGGQELGAVPALNMAGNATLLDFASLSEPIEKWQRTYNMTEDSTAWVNEADPAVDLKVVVTPQDGTPSMYQASYRYNATISISGPAQAEGNTIGTEAQGGNKLLLMLGVIVGSFVVAVAASWRYRSRRRQLPRKRK